jgi:predicted helicase
MLAVARRTAPSTSENSEALAEFYELGAAAPRSRASTTRRVKQRVITELYEKFFAVGVSNGLG